MEYAVDFADAINQLKNTISRSADWRRLPKHLLRVRNDRLLGSGSASQHPTFQPCSGSLIDPANVDLESALIRQGSVGSQHPARGLVRVVWSQLKLLPMNIPRGLALLATIMVSLAPCRADKDVAVSQLPRPILKAVEARYPSGHILEAELDSEGYYEIKLQDGQNRHLLHVRPKRKIIKDEPD